MSAINEQLDAAHAVIDRILAEKTVEEREQLIDTFINMTREAYRRADEIGCDAMLDEAKQWGESAPWIISWVLTQLERYAQVTQ